MSAEEPTIKELPPIFLDISPNTLPTEMDSLCMNCHEQATTRMLLTKIPYFREVMISRSECEHCGYCDNAIQFAGEYPSKGVEFTLHASSAEDLNRRVIKSCHGTIKIPEIDLEIPGQTQADSINTVEGILARCYDGIKQSNPNPTPEIEEFLDNLDQCRKGLVQFTFILNDPSGNSFIENPSAPAKDPLLDVHFYRRTPAQCESIGLMAQPKGDEFQIDDVSKTDLDHFRSVFATDTPVMEMESPCPVCSADGINRSCTLSIPFFKEIIIMAFNCDSCGYRNGEVMVGGEISNCGRRTTLVADTPADLNRELLKSELAAVEIPEADIKLAPGTLGGKFTTVEGLVRDIHRQLSEENPFMQGDSALNDERRAHFEGVLQMLLDFADAKKPFTLILDDPMSNSFVQRLSDSDPKPVNEDYERTFEQNEELGLNDIRTEGYEEVPADSQ